MNYWHHPKVGEDIQGESPLERNLHPEACAQCHQQQFNAWKGSRHALAYSPGLVGQFFSMGHQAGNDCLVCHAPLDRQQYKTPKDLVNSLSLLKRYAKGFDAEGSLDDMPVSLPLRHAGVTCAVCHIRDGQRFGPPRKGTDIVGKLSGAAHGGFIASKGFEQANFCASCHQFPQSYAINGKPLENTLEEWKQSRFSREGVQCQSCHMPDRQHLFRGVHDVDMVRSGLGFDVQQGDGWVRLRMSSVYIGHAFPSYVTPKVNIKAKGLDKYGHEVQTWQWSLQRKVFYDGGWQEASDTRLMPGERRVFMANRLKEDVVQVLFQVDVIPDDFYKGVYENLLQDMQEGTSRTLIQRALKDAGKNDYRLYQVTVDRKK
ncbi:MAG: hypothetical protein COA61_005290 [Zetaproteobacteria bacterium]|nr:hypothetical protein [Zetaproteobacteria bacterium]